MMMESIDLSHFDKTPNLFQLSVELFSLGDESYVALSPSIEISGNNCASERTLVSYLQ